MRIGNAKVVKEDEESSPSLPEENVGLILQSDGMVERT